LQRWYGIDFGNYTLRKTECNGYINKNNPSCDGLAEEEGVTEKSYFSTSDSRGGISDTQLAHVDGVRTQSPN
jgi:hypothetical protein